MTNQEAFESPRQMMNVNETLREMLSLNNGAMNTIPHDMDSRIVTVACSRFHLHA